MKKRSFDYLFNIAEQIQHTSALEAKQIAFIPRLMATASLPVRESKDNEFIRRNGNRTLTMLASRDIGLPYGAMPRLALCAITTLSKQNQSNIITLGSSTTQFLNLMGKACTGGKNGSLTYAREQLKRLLSCTIQITENAEQRWDMTSLRVSQSATILWQPCSPYRWQSQLILSDEFFQHTQRYAIPVDLRVLHACGHYPLAIDVYCWLTYRYFSLKRPIAISWADLMIQFGNSYQRGAHFKSNFREAMERVFLFYPQARFNIDQFGVQLLPSPTHVPAKDLNQFLNPGE